MRHSGLCLTHRCLVNVNLCSILVIAPGNIGFYIFTVHINVVQEGTFSGTPTKYPPNSCKKP